MMALDRDAVICDFLQYYGITNLKQFTNEEVAIYACGLPSDARIIKKLANRKYTLTETLTAGILDTLKSLEYLYLKKNFKGQFKVPKSVLKSLEGTEESEKEFTTFDSAEEFERRKAEILNS